MSKLFSPDFPFKPSRFPVHYGWVVAVAAATSMVASIPGQTIGVNVFNEELIVSLGLSRSQVALAYFIGTAASGIILVWAGTIYDRIGALRLIVGSSLGLGVSLFYLSSVDWLPVMAARMLDDEAQVVVDQMGRMPEARMLLMAGLMLADATEAARDRNRELEAALAERDAELAQLRSAPAPEPERVEVPVVPQSVTDTLAELAARAEALARDIEEKAQSDTDAA